MITSTLSQLHWYKIISPSFTKAINYALATDFAPMEPGKYEIDGDTVFAIVNEFTTKPAAECELEAHQLYADIQIVVSGTEKFGYTPLVKQEPSSPYNTENDVSFYSIPEEEISYLTLAAGQFIIFFPSDIHQPETFHHQPELVKKVVLKVKVEGTSLSYD